MYVSFVEGRKSFIEKMLGLGLDFDKLELSEKFRVLGMLTLKDIDLPVVIEQVLMEVADIRANMLVINPLSAMSQVAEKPYDTRRPVHTILAILLGRWVARQ